MKWGIKCKHPFEVSASEHHPFDAEHKKCQKIIIDAITISDIYRFKILQIFIKNQLSKCCNKTDICNLSLPFSGSMDIK